MDGMTMPTSTGRGTFSASPTGSSTFDYTTPTPSVGTESADSMGDMGGMGSMETSAGNCKVSMLWNWYTIDACFLSESWQIKSNGGFAGLCIGVLLLVILLELLRRAAKIYDQYLVQQHQKTAALVATVVNGSSETANGALITKERLPAEVRITPFRPNVWQQTVRALLHTLHFALAYWIMLLAMYYNGYIIICIIIGAFIGFFAFQWEHIGPRKGNSPGIGVGRYATGCHG
ncbi:Ctr-domain-containing protein [Hypoxylon crocopeplum]|nr:Ctr-domain-containing protein [Hypoxylon crocopeplum]